MPPSFFGSVDIKQECPSIENIEVELNLCGPGIKERGGKTSIYSAGYIPRYIACPNPSCSGGNGFSVWALVDEMISRRQTDGEISAMCQGHEPFRRCLSSIGIKVHIDYKK
jgi:hypothetical protein